MMKQHTESIIKDLQKIVDAIPDGAVAPPTVGELMITALLAEIAQSLARIADREATTK